MPRLLHLFTIILVLIIGGPLHVDAKGHKLISSVKFDGKVKKKIPMGNGTLMIERYRYDNNPFLINGVFNEDTIRNATVTVNGSTLFNGDFKYSLSPDKKGGDAGSKVFVSFLILKGQVNGIDVENFGPIIFTNSFSYHGGFGTSLDGSDVEMKESQLTTDSILNITDSNILLAHIKEITYSARIYYDNRHWDYSSRKYYPVFKYIFTPKIVKYDNGLILKINSDNGQSTYTLESEAGSHLSFSTYGKLNTEGLIKLKHNGKLSLLNKKDYSSDEFMLTYPDGTKYTGSLQSLKFSEFSLPSIISTLPKLEASNASDFKPRNGKIVYGISDGITQDEYINGERKSVIDAREKKKEEDYAKERAAKERQRVAQENAVYNQWVKQYGQKAANAIKDREPYIGMPEKAFRNISGYSLREESGSQRVYVKYGKWFGQFNTSYYDSDAIYSIVVCSGGKIVRITYP